MKYGFGKRLLLVVMFGLIGLGILLGTNHWGMAIKIANYLFFILFLCVLYEIIFFKK